MSSIYPVQPGMSIADVVVNATGTRANLNQVLADNGFDSWTPDLIPGQEIIISDAVVMDNNALQQLKQYPVCNNVDIGIYAQIEEIFSLLADLWILRTGDWDDTGIWIDSDLWID